MAHLRGILNDLARFLPLSLHWETGNFQLIDQLFNFLLGLLSLEYTVFFSHPINKVLKKFISILFFTSFESCVSDYFFREDVVFA